MAGKNTAARPASWRVLYVDSSGKNRVSTVKSQAEADALVAEFAGQAITARVKATAAAWQARFVDEGERAGGSAAGLRRGSPGTSPGEVQAGPGGVAVHQVRGNPWRSKTFCNEWRKRLDAAGLAGFDLHELRH